jgi:hypothetical protein
MAAVTVVAVTVVAVTVVAVTAAPTPEVMRQYPRVAVVMPDSPEVVAVVTGPEPAAVLEAGEAARVVSSARFCGSRGICPEISNP